MRLRTLTCLAVLALVAAGVWAAPAAADSIVFIKANNVWLSNADGSGQYQVTLDGSAAAPYESPSQADDGTIVAVRAAPGQRRQLYRMTQSGGLLNAPINTPAPGTGAINAKVSPDGRLVAYWFATTVATGTCPFCIEVASRALISHVDRFTNFDEPGLTPNTGAWPSWLSNNQLMLSQGAADYWFYTLGAPEGQAWFADSDFVTMNFQNLTDGEASRTGGRLAIVRGNNQETILLASFTGPPAKPATNFCGLQGPNGKFVGPTWSNDGQTLAWQENDGIWTDQIVSVTDCNASPPAVLRIPGGSAPDFGPAAVNPGARPACGNPGNPAACPPGCTTCTPGATLKDQLSALLAAEAKALTKLKLRGLIKRGRKVTFNAPGPGTLAVKLAKKSKVLASARHVYKAAGKGTLTLKLSKKGKKALRRARSAKLTLSVSFTPAGGKATTVKKSLTLKR